MALIKCKECGKEISDKAEKDAELLRLQKELAKFKANQSSIT